MNRRCISLVAPGAAATSRFLDLGASRERHWTIGSPHTEILVGGVYRKSNTRLPKDVFGQVQYLHIEVARLIEGDIKLSCQVPAHACKRTRTIDYRLTIIITRCTKPIQTLAHHKKKKKHIKDYKGMSPSFTDSLTWCAWPQATAAKLLRALEIVWQLRVGFVKTQGFTSTHLGHLGFHESSGMVSVGGPSIQLHSYHVRTCLNLIDHA